MNEKVFIFLEAFFIAVLVLIIGFIIGYAIESARLNSALNDYRQFEVSMLDLKLQDYYFQTIDQGQCSQAISANFNFSDKVYQTGLDIEKYEQNSQILTGMILTEKEQYVLLKTEIWLNSVLLKNRCGDPFHTIVYFYSQNPSETTRQEQAAISDTLKQLKDKYGNALILLPIAGDLNLDIVSIQMENYNITSLPTILIDEHTKLEGYQSLSTLEKYI